jgi:hypothetical protein
MFFLGTPMIRFYVEIWFISCQEHELMWEVVCLAQQSNKVYNSWIDHSPLMHIVMQDPWGERLHAFHYLSN